MTKKPTSKKSTNGKPQRKPNPMHDALVKLMTRPNGADITEIKGTGFNAPCMQALKLVERRGFKTRVVKKAGELARYVAKRS
jgi:hypothetical protein